MRPRVGISRCLLGERVRYDGGHKLEAPLVERLAARIEWVDVCPEVEVGMGVPREPVQLVPPDDAMPAGPGRARLVGVHTTADWTDRMRKWALARVEQLASMRLSGFVLKARSPSCGLRDVPIGGSGGPAAVVGAGAFTTVLVERLPDLPVEDEERLRDPVALADFLDRVEARHRRINSG
jgi:uncharacterized protein YbbK (DUF523 family)